MEKARSQRLERNHACLERAPTYDELPDRVDADHPSIEERGLPLVAADKNLLWEFDEELQFVKSKTYHAILLEHLHHFCKFRRKPTPNRRPDSAHGIGLRELLNQNSTGELFINWVEKLVKEDGSQISETMEKQYRDAVRQFGDLVGPQGRPGHIDAIASTPKRTQHGRTRRDPSPPRSSIIGWEELAKNVLDRPDVNDRDTACFAVEWETGGRPDEVFDMQTKQLTDRGDYILFEIADGKTYRREPHIHASMPYFMNWLLKLDEMTEDVQGTSSPLSIPPEQPIWTRLDTPTQISDSTWRGRGPRVAERIGFGKPMNPKHFRKCRASVLAAQEDLDERFLRQRFGWTAASSSPKYYIAAFSQEANRQIAKADGATSLEFDQRFEDPAPVKCGRCDQWIPQHYTECMWCNCELTGKEPEGTTESTRLINKTQDHHDAVNEITNQLDAVDLSVDTLKTGMEIAKVLDSNPRLAPEGLLLQAVLEEDGPDIDDAVQILSSENPEIEQIAKGILDD